MIVSKRQRGSATSADRRGNRMEIIMAGRTEQGRLGRGKLLLTAQATGREKQLEKGCEEGAQETHDVWSRQSFAQKFFSDLPTRAGVIIHDDYPHFFVG